MTSLLARLRALVEESFSAAPANEQPEAFARRLSAELDAWFNALFASEQAISFDELSALADEFRDRSRTLPKEVQQAHSDWWRVQTRAYKLVLGPDGMPCAPDLPPGTPSAPMVLTPRFFEQLGELRYKLHRRDQESACDCAALIACKVYREPRSPNLRSLGPSTDGCHSGEAFLCDACGARWFCGDGQGSLYHVFWEPQKDA